MTEKATAKYIEAVGRRKTAVARVRLEKSKSYSYDVNGKKLDAYLPVRELRHSVEQAFSVADIPQKFSVSARVKGGGMAAQTEALRLGIARALIKYEPETRAALKSHKLLKRDPRVKERKKFGLKKARRAPQWSKR